MNRHIFSYCLMMLVLCTPTFSQEMLRLNWSTILGGTDVVVVNDLEVDAAGNCFLAGFFKGTMDADPGPDSTLLRSAGGKDGFIICLDAQGSLKWAERIGGEGEDEIRRVTLDQSGNLYGTGIFGIRIDIDPGEAGFWLQADHYNDLFFFKWTAKRTLVWAWSPKGKSFKVCDAIAADTNGNFFAAGGFHLEVDFDPGPAVRTFTTPANSREMVYKGFVLKLDPRGQLRWARELNSPEEVIPKSIAVDEEGNVTAAGYFKSKANFDEEAVGADCLSAGAWDGFIVQYDREGAFRWVSSLGGKGMDVVNDIIAGPGGQLQLTGQFFKQAVFHTRAQRDTLLSAGLTDCFLMQLSRQGRLLAIRRLGGKSLDAGLSISMPNDSICWVVGSHDGKLEFGSHTEYYSVGKEGQVGSILHGWLSDKTVSGALLYGGKWIKVAANQSVHLWVIGNFWNFCQLEVGGDAEMFQTGGSRQMILCNFTMNN
jgi:hypothetical protein